MSITSLTITSLQKDMTWDEVKQKLVKLYNLQEENCEELFSSLFIKHQPYVFFKQVDESMAHMHLKRLTKIGFNCRCIEDEFGGLSIAPIAEAKPVEVDCPACDQLAGSEEICQHCGVIMHKYLQQRNFDDQFQRQMNATTNSQARMQQHHAERSKREKELNRAKKRNDKSTNVTPQSNDAVDEVTVDTKEKTSQLLYATMASVCLVIVGAGYFIYEHVENRYISDGFMAKSVANISPTSDANLSTISDEGPGESLTIAFVDQTEDIDSFQHTVFDIRLQREREFEKLGQQIERLYKNDLVLTAGGLVSGKEDPRDRIFGNQELIKLKGFNPNTRKKLEDIHTLAIELDSDVDRIDALLHQSDIYLHFELHEEAAEIYEEAARIAFDINDNEEERILAEIKMAKHQLDHGGINTAIQRYQNAKDKAAELGQHALTDAAFSYIALSEAAEGLSENANITNEMIVDNGIRESSLMEISRIIEKTQPLTVPGIAAAHEQEKTGDPLIDDLIEMTEQNKRTLEAASQLSKVLTGLSH